jgi:anti-sigma factor RsiW
MNHQETYFALSAFIDNELGEIERRAVADHLESCAECRARVDQLWTLKRNIHSAGNVELPYAFANALTRSIHHREELTVSWLGIEHSARNLVVGLAAVVMLLFGLTSFKQSEESSTTEHISTVLLGDSAASQILNKGGAVSRDDVMLAALSK